MRRLLILFILVCCASLSAYAQGELVIYDFTQGARIYRQDAKKWDTLHKNERVTENTLVNCKAKGAIQILDKRTNIIYSNVNTGNQRISEVVKSSAKRANSTFKNLNAQISKNVKGGTQSSKNLIYGATVRGNEELSVYDSLYYSVYNGIVNNKVSDVISSNRVALDDDTFYFSITNSSDIKYYITIIRTSESGTYICVRDDIYNFDIITISPQSTIELKDLIFLDESSEYKYYLVASTNTFSLKPIESALKYMTPPEYEIDTFIVDIIPSR